MPTMNEIRFNMPDAEYRAAPGESVSALKHMLRSPAHYAWHKEHPDPATPAMLVGTLTHLAAMQPDLFGEGVSHADD